MKVYAIVITERFQKRESSIQLRESSIQLRAIRDSHKKYWTFVTDLKVIWTKSMNEMKLKSDKRNIAKVLLRNWVWFKYMELVAVVKKYNNVCNESCQKEN